MIRAGSCLKIAVVRSSERATSPLQMSWPSIAKANFPPVTSENARLTIASIALSLVTGGKLAFAIDGQLICSGLVARSLERTTAIFKHDPARIMPAELAEIYDVDPPARDTPRGRPPGRAG
jgi:hypothetical protein